MDWEKAKAEVLNKLDIEKEAELLGVIFAGPVSKSGWRPCHNPFRKDDHASCGVCLEGPRRGMLCAFNVTDEGKMKPHMAWNFWNLARDLLPGSCGDFKIVFDHYAQKVGYKYKVHAPPTEELVMQFQDRLAEAPDVQLYLHTMRHFNDDTIRRHQVGWDVKKQRITFPVRDEQGVLVNIRYHNSQSNPKTLNHPGYGVARLWGLDRLTKQPPGSTIVITEGEFDAMLCEQESGIVSVSPTNGTMAFDQAWVSFFKGHHVVFCWDCDEAGRTAAHGKIQPIFRKAVLNGEILSLKFVWLFEKPEKDRKDFTDWIVRAGGSGGTFREIMENTSIHEYGTPAAVLPPAISLSDFSQIAYEKYHGRRVSVPLYVYGENSEAFFTTTEFEVTFCPLMAKSQCFKQDDPDVSFYCSQPIPIPFGHPVQLACIGTSDMQMLGALRNYCCDKNKKPHVKIRPESKKAIREVYAHQVLEMSSSYGDPFERQIYVSGGANINIGRYLATGFVVSHPKDQKPTIIVDTLEPQQEDWQSFNLETARPTLKKLQEAGILRIIEELNSITRIYERDDLHLGVLLTMVSPRWFHMPSEGRVRGRVNTIIIGDSGTGKTSISELMFQYAAVGFRISGMTSSRTGITYACEYDEQHGWRVKAGAMLKMSRQALIVDEAQDLPEVDLKTMAEGIDTGVISIARIETRKFECETRVLFSCNPKAPDRTANQRTMDTFWYGCKSLSDIFPVMFIRRIDLALFATSYDIKDPTKLFTRRPVEVEVLTKEAFRALVHFAWNLRDDQVVISEEVNDLILQEAFKLSQRFGQADDLPIVYPQDFRKTFARLCVAMAVACLSSTDDFETITVTKQHVAMMATFVNDIYGNENCRLNVYSDSYKAEHKMDDPETIYNDLKEMIMERPDSEARLGFIFNELLKIDPMKGEKVAQRYLAECLDCSRLTINADLTLAVKYRLVKSQRGYIPTTKFVRFKWWLEEHHPEFLNLDKT